jgi:hypothetical protein
MTWTLAPDQQDATRRALNRRPARESRGEVFYPPQFRNLSLPHDVRPSGSVPRSVLREPAREPGSPLSWYDAQIDAWESWQAPRGFWAAVIVVAVTAFVLGAIAAL